MSDKSDWDEIKNESENYKNEMKAKYGIDLQEYGKKYASKEFVRKNNKMKIVFKKVCIVVIIIFILVSWIQWKALNTRIEIKKELKNIYDTALTEEKHGVDLFGNGFSVYKIDEAPEIEVHSMFSTIKRTERLMI